MRSDKEFGKMKNESIKEEVLPVFISERDHNFLSGCSNINNIQTGGSRVNVILKTFRSKCILIFDAE